MVSYGGNAYIQSFMMDRVCRVNLDYSSTICDDLNNPDNENEKEAVALFSTQLFFYRMMVLCFPMVFYVLITGDETQIYTNSQRWCSFSKRQRF